MGFSTQVFCEKLKNESFLVTGRHAYFWDFYQSPDFEIGTNRYLYVCSDQKREETKDWSRSPKLL